MIVQQFFLRGIAHSSYLIGGRDACAIVDPRRDVDIYASAAEDLGLEITHVLETHLHADFVSGHIDLVDLADAEIVAPKKARCRFPHDGVQDGDMLEIERMEISVLETPGHTPEHVSYVVVDSARGPDPVGVFSGDALFVGDVGRPDLFPGRSRELASMLYDSVHERLLALPDYCELYPAHGAGSLCGRLMGAKRRSTIGYERRYNRSLKLSRDDFIESLTTDMPEAPDHFKRCSEVNREGPTAVSELPKLAKLGPSEFRELSNRRNTVILDVRGYDSFGGQHIPGSWHVDLSGNFSTYAGWVLPPDHDILLVAEGLGGAENAALGLRRVGLDRPVGYLYGGLPSWSREGLPIGHVPQLSAHELHRMATGNQEMVILDVRGNTEYVKSSIVGSVNIPAPSLRTRYSELDPGVPAVAVCSTGMRSSLGASILRQHGHDRIFNLAGGLTGYSAAGYIPECPVCAIPHGPQFLGGEADWSPVG